MGHPKTEISEENILRLIMSRDDEVEKMKQLISL